MAAAVITDLRAHSLLKMEGSDQRTQRLILAATFTVDGRKVQIDAARHRFTAEGVARSYEQLHDEALAELIGKALAAVAS